MKEVLAPRYRVKWDEDFAEGQLDTYREWIDKRSRCPKCDCTGWQTDDGDYRCPLCVVEWGVGADVTRQVYRKAK